MKIILFLYILVSLIISSCTSTQAVEPTATSVPATEVVAPTSTVIPSETAEAFPTETATIAPTTTATVEPTPTERVPNTPFEGIVGFPELNSRQFKIPYSPQIGAWGLVAQIKEIIFIPEGETIVSGSDEEVTAVFIIEYYDAKGQIQEMRLGAALQNESYGDNGSSIIIGIGWTYEEAMPDFYIKGIIENNFFVGDRIVILFGTPNSKTANVDGIGYTNDLVSLLYTEEQMAEFVETGDPSVFGDGVFIPLTFD